jgi:hypothetical protein
VCWIGLTKHKTTAPAFDKVFDSLGVHCPHQVITWGLGQCHTLVLTVFDITKSL